MCRSFLHLFIMNSGNFKYSDYVTPPLIGKKIVTVQSEYFSIE